VRQASAHSVFCFQQIGMGGLDVGDEAWIASPGWVLDAVVTKLRSWSVLRFAGNASPL